MKLCGQRFWEFISARKNLYTDIIEPLGSRAKERKEEFEIELRELPIGSPKNFLMFIVCQTARYNGKSLFSSIRALFHQGNARLILVPQLVPVFPAGHGAFELSSLPPAPSGAESL